MFVTCAGTELWLHQRRLSSERKQSAPHVAARQCAHWKEQQDYIIWNYFHNRVLLFLQSAVSGLFSVQRVVCSRRKLVHHDNCALGRVGISPTPTECLQQRLQREDVSLTMLRPDGWTGRRLARVRTPQHFKHDVTPHSEMASAWAGSDVMCRPPCRGIMSVSADMFTYSMS